MRADPVVNQGGVHDPVLAGALRGVDRVGRAQYTDLAHRHVTSLAYRPVTEPRTPHVTEPRTRGPG